MTPRAAALAVAALLALALPAIAIAHGALISSDPADGATITTPYAVTATFNEEIDPEASSLLVENASGTQVAAGTVDPDDHTRMTALLPALPDGEYIVRWTSVTPDDSGVERGSFRFTVAAAAASPTPTPSSTSGDTVGSDLLIALVLAAVAIGAVVLFVFLRGRR